MPDASNGRAASDAPCLQHQFATLWEREGSVVDSSSGSGGDGDGEKRDMKRMRNKEVNPGESEPFNYAFVR